MLSSVFPFLIRVRLTTKLRWSKKDDNNLGDVRQMLMNSALEVVGASWVLDSEAL